MQALSRLLLNIGASGLVGCAHKTEPKNTTSEYVSAKDQPSRAKDYWDKRSKEDKTDNLIERTPGSGIIRAFMLPIFL